MRADQILPSDHSTIINQESIAMGITQSEMMTWDECPEKWYLGYNHMLTLKGAWARYFVYGDAFHSCMDRFYRDGDESVPDLEPPPGAILTGEDEFWFELWSKILKVQMQRYFTYYQDDRKAWKIFLNETIVTVEWEGVKWTGKLDLGIEYNNVATLADHKSAGRFDMATLNGWDFRFQFMFYLWLMEKHTGRKIPQFMVNGLKKPELRIGKGESMQTFVNRIEQHMIQEPEKYFKRVPLLRVQGSMEHFEQRVLRPKLNKIRLLTEPTTPAIVLESLARNQNTGNCVKYGSTCQFMRICQHGFKREGFQYTRREHKHEELEAE
jgi:hypothetical protein